MSVDPKKLLIVGNWAAVARADGKILFLKRAENEILGGGNFGFPGGKSEKGEDCFSALAREVREEAGLEIANPQFLHHAAWPRIDDWVMGFFWLCELKGSGEVKLDEREHSEFRWVAEEELKDLQISPLVREVLAKAFAALRGRGMTPAAE